MNFTTKMSHRTIFNLYRCLLHSILSVSTPSSCLNRPAYYYTQYPLPLPSLLPARAVARSFLPAWLLIARRVGDSCARLRDIRVTVAWIRPLSFALKFPYGSTASHIDWGAHPLSLPILFPPNMRKRPCTVHGRQGKLICCYFDTGVMIGFSVDQYRGN